VGGTNIHIVHYFDHSYLEDDKSMIHGFTVTFGAKYLTAAFVVVPTDKICGRSLSSKIPVDINSIFMKLYVTWPT
jgi:hypothetical protein